MLQKLGKIKVGTLFLKTLFVIKSDIICISCKLKVCSELSGSSHLLVEFVMAGHMIFSLLKLVPNSVKYST